MVKYKINKLNIMFGVIFAALGILMLVMILCISASWNSFKETAREVTAVITDIDVRRTATRKNGKTRHRTEHTVYIEYTVDGNEYRNTLGYYNGGMAEGDNVTILYDPENPDRHMSDPTVSCIVMGVFLLIFGGIGLGFLMCEFNRSRFVNRLIEKNLYVVCYDWEEVTSGTKVNNVRYKQIICYYEDLGRSFQFRSAPYHPNKCPFIHGQPITVYVDLEKPKKYYVYMEVTD